MTKQSSKALLMENKTVLWFCCLSFWSVRMLRSSLSKNEKQQRRHFHYDRICDLLSGLTSFMDWGQSAVNQFNNSGYRSITSCWCAAMLPSSVIMWWWCCGWLFPELDRTRQSVLQAVDSSGDMAARARRGTLGHNSVGLFNFDIISLKLYR